MKIRKGKPVEELRPIRLRRFVPRATIADAARNAARINAEQFRADLNADCRYTRNPSDFGALKRMLKDVKI